LTKAQRINACIRACAGIPDDVISDPGYSIKAELDTLDNQIEMRTKAEQERDELLAALKKISVLSGSSNRYIDDYGEIARDIIAKIEVENEI